MNTESAIDALGSLIERIKARVADPAHAVDAAAWVAPMPTVLPPATTAEVDAAEAAIGFPIPAVLRRLYLEVGNGGFGPNYGLEGVPTIPPAPKTSNIVVMYKWYSSTSPDYPANIWPVGLVPLISGGCLYWECVDFLNPPHAVVMFDGNDCDLERPVTESLKPVAASFTTRLESWLSNNGKV